MNPGGDHETRLSDRVRRAHSSSPEWIGGYRREHALGDGGMGAVFAYRDTRLDRLVAIKAMPPEMQTLTMYAAVGASQESTSLQINP